MPIGHRVIYSVVHDYHAILGIHGEDRPCDDCDVELNQPNDQSPPFPCANLNKPLTFAKMK